jgi:hypothetical protein
LEDAVKRLSQQTCPLNSFLLKFGVTWLTTAKAGPIITVEKILENGNPVIKPRYFPYEAIMK